MLKRTLSFLSLLTYMASNSTLNQNQFAQAAMYLQVYEKVDPENSEVYYLQALLAAKQENWQAVIPRLQKAVEVGFIDLERLIKEEFFNSVKQSAEFGALVEKIKAMK